MNRYIRLMNNKIYDTQKKQKTLNNNKYHLIDGMVIEQYYESYSNEFGDYCETPEFRNLGCIKKESNNILDLIELGDLVSVNWTDCENDKYPREVVGVGDNYINVDNDFYEDDKYEDHTNYITELYIKQGNDYILVWNKDKGVI